MKRIGKYTLNAAALLSLLLCLASAALWLRSHAVRDYAFVWIRYPADAAGPRWIKLDADTAVGQFTLSWKLWTAAQREQLRQRNPLGGQSVYHRTFPDLPRGYAVSIPPARWNSIGFGLYSGPTHSSIWFPYWFAAIITAAPPALWAAIRARRLRRILAGRCAACGYDLRATPDRCPECGKTPATANA